MMKINARRIRDRAAEQTNIVIRRSQIIHHLHLVSFR